MQCLFFCYFNYRGDRYTATPEEKVCVLSRSVKTDFVPQRRAAQLAVLAVRSNNR